MMLVQSLPHTPAITSFAAQIPSYKEQAENRKSKSRNKSFAHSSANKNDEDENDEAGE